MDLDSVVVQSLSHIQFFATLWTAALQALASLFFTISQSLLRLRSIESVMPFNHLILCCFFFLLSTNIPSNVSLISSSNQVAKVSELQHRSFQWILLAIVQVTFCSRLFISKSQDLNSIHWKKTLSENQLCIQQGAKKCIRKREGSSHPQGNWTHMTVLLCWDWAFS